VRANQPPTSDTSRTVARAPAPTLGMTRLAAVLLQLEKLGKSGVLAGAEPLCAETRREFQEHPDLPGVATSFAATPVAVVNP